MESTWVFVFFIFPSMYYTRGLAVDFCFLKIPAMHWVIYKENILEMAKHIDSIFQNHCVSPKGKFSEACESDNSSVEGILFYRILGTTKMPEGAWPM